MPYLDSHPVVDAVLDRHRDAIGDSFATYRNHALRGLNYQTLLLAGMGRQVSNAQALVWAVHDLGIWTAGTFDYLQPSADLLHKYAAEFGITDIAQAEATVLRHHRIRKVADIEVDTFRRADRVDVTRGFWRGAISRKDVAGVVVVLPYLGFHKFLAAGLTRHAVSHPRRPVPMLRW
jgi:hypothetical protein